MGKRGQNFITRSGSKGVVLQDNGNTLFVKFFGGDTTNISASEISEFYRNRGRGKSRKASSRSSQQGLPVSNKPCGNCGSNEPHYVGGGHRCSLCDTEYLEGFKNWYFASVSHK